MTFNHIAKIQPPSRLANTCPASPEQSVPDFARIPFFPYLCENIKRDKWMETILNDYPQFMDGHSGKTDHPTAQISS